MDQTEDLATETRLTPRQMDCMNLVERGLTSKQIAKKLGISPRTVDQHIAAVLDIFQVNNRIAAVRCLRETASAKKTDSDAKVATFMFKYPSNQSDLLSSGILQTRLDPNERALSGKAPYMPAFGGSRNVATKLERFGWIIKITLLAIMASCFVTLFIMGLSRMA